jgi:outer membrane lipoprotein carrier protein
LRWEYKTPNQQVIVADGNRIWLHDIELKQASFRSQKTVLKGTPAQLLSNTDPVDKHFQVNELPDQDDLSWIELVPKEKEAQFSSVRLAFNGNSLERMDMYDTFGQVTRFFFYNMQRNPNLSNSLFEFEPPPLIDLIGDL